MNCTWYSTVSEVLIQSAGSVQSGQANKIRAASRLPTCLKTATGNIISHSAMPCGKNKQNTSSASAFYEKINNKGSATT